MGSWVYSTPGPALKFGTYFLFLQSVVSSSSYGLMKVVVSLVGTWKLFLCHLENTCYMCVYFHLFVDDMIPALARFTSA